MIAYVRGRVDHVSVDTAVVEVGGVGVAVLCAPATLATMQVGQTARLATSLVVREDSLTLYAFADEDERGVFELLLTASGVGPRLAQAMIAVHGADGLRSAVAREDLVALTKVPGIGKKGAQRVVLELKDRLGQPRGAAGGSQDAESADAASAWREQVRAGLVSLGWSAREADAAVEAVEPLADEQGPDADVPTLLKAALRTLSRA